MFDHRSKRAALLPALFAVAVASLAACSGGAAAGSNPIAASSGNGGTGTGGPGSGTATASPPAGGVGPGTGNGASSAPSAAPSAVASSASTPSSLDSISVVPAVLDGDLGGVAQIGILDPNYSGPYSVTVTGGGLLLNSLLTLSNIVNGTLSGTGGETVLSLNLANAVQLGLLGPSGDVVQICEQQNPSTCKSVSITNNSVVPQIGASLDSIVLGPSGTQTLSLIAPTLESLTGFTVSAAPQGIQVSNLGNGRFEIGAVANVAVPLTGTVTFTNGTQTITIPIAVL